MSHEFESGMFVGEAAWHRLGNTLPVDSPARYDVAAAMREAEMNWRTFLTPIGIPNLESVDVSGNGDDLRHIPEGVRGKIAADQFAVCRDSDNSILGIVGSKYRCYQNADLFNWFQPFLDEKLAQFETAGSLMNGKIVWVLAKLNRDDSVIVADSQRPDTVRKYLLLTSSHDGSKAHRVGFCPTRVVCWNTLSMALRDGRSELLRVKHTKNQGNALAAIRETINAADASFEATAEQYRRMAQMPINRQDLVDYVRKVFEQPTDAEIKAALNAGTKAPTVSTKMSNILDVVLDHAANGIGQDTAEGSVWAAYNGVTQYLTHDRGRSDDNRLRAVWYGDASKINDRALSLAMQLAG